MKKTIFTTLSGFMAFVAAFCYVPAQAQNATQNSAQNEFKFEEISAVDFGDGRTLHLELKSEPMTRLNGRYRLIHGLLSEYILAEFTDGFYNGSYEHHRNNALLEKGIYKEGRREGIFTLYYSDGTVEQQTSWKGNELDGALKNYYPDGSLRIETGFKAGKAEGILKSYHPDGSLKTERSYKEGELHGVERTFEQGADKPSVDRNWFEGVPDGSQYAEISSNTGDYIEVAYFDKGTPTGEFLQTWAESGDVKQRGSYGSGGKEGVWTEIRRDGKIESETTWAGGKRNGPSKTFFTDNSVEKITNYVDDKREGVEQTFRFDGGRLASEYTYVADRKEGDYKMYYDDQKPTLREEGRIRRGNEVWRKEYYPNGNVKRVQERPTSGGTWTTLESYDEKGKRLDQ